MNNKGFTLIELLAVIVILAIIALIATPIILGIINDTRASASERSAELIVSNVELAYSTAYMKDGNIPTLAEVVSKFKMDNAKMKDDGTIEPADSNIKCTTTTTGNKLDVVCTANSTEFKPATEMLLSTGTTTPETGE